MPELPEVETTRRSLLPLQGQRVTAVQVNQPRLRWPVPDDLHRLQGQTLLDVTRRAKYLLARFETDTVLMHLGMSGSFQIAPAAAPLRKHDHVALSFADQQLRYHDPRRFGCLLWAPGGQHPLLVGLGPEPLSTGFDATHLHQQLQKTRRPIKVALMDNAVVVGVGNIYATEALFHAGIHPATPAHAVDFGQCEALTQHIRRILQNAIELGGSTLRDFANAQGNSGYFQQTLWAYGRVDQPCRTCQTPLDSLRLGQRASAFCPKCQPFIPTPVGTTSAKKPTSAHD